MSHKKVYLQWNKDKEILRSNDTFPISFFILLMPVLIKTHIRSCKTYFMYNEHLETLPQTIEKKVQFILYEHKYGTYTIWVYVYTTLFVVFILHAKIGDGQIKPCTQVANNT